MESLNELEGWVLEVAAQVEDPIRPQPTRPATRLLKHRPAWLTRAALVRVLRPANTNPREGLSWGREQEEELDQAIKTLLKHGFLERVSMLTKEAESHEFLMGLQRRIAALESGHEAAPDVYVDEGPYKITPAGFLQLRDMKAVKSASAEGD